MKKLALALLLYAVAVVTIAFLYERGTVLALILAVYAVVAWRLDPHPEDAFTLIGGAVFGPAAEAAAVWRGAWSYTWPDFLGIPIWLPVGWALACLLLKRLSEAVRDLIAARESAA